MFGVATNIRQFISERMNLWNTESTAGDQNLGNVMIKHKVFQADSLSPLSLGW